MERLTPSDDRQTADLIRDAANSSKPLEILSSGTKRDIGRPIAADSLLDVSALSGVISYQPEELVLTARAGTKLAEIEALLAVHNQMLGFEPADHAPLFGKPLGIQTLAGIAAADICGPRRVRFGPVRDSVIGCRFVNGAGEIIAAGGRVIKNVTGFDIPKLMCGAFGTLGVLTEITFRVFPRPAQVGALVLRNCAADVGLRALRRAASLPVEPTGLAFLPEPALRRFDPAQIGSQGQAFIRVEGSAAALAEKLEYLQTEFRDFDCAVIGPVETASCFRLIGSGGIFNASDGDLWRLCVPPAAARHAIAEAGATLWYADWGGGLIWLQMPANPEAAQTLRGITAKMTGHATLFRASHEARRMIGVFEPESEVRAKLTRNLKHAFDPESVLNRGRMFEYF